MCLESGWKFLYKSSVFKVKRDKSEQCCEIPAIAQEKAGATSNLIENSKLHGLSVYSSCREYCRRTSGLAGFHHAG